MGRGCTCMSVSAENDLEDVDVDVGGGVARWQ